MRLFDKEYKILENYNDAFNEKIKMFTCNNMTSGNKDVHIASIDKDIMYDSCVKQK